MGPSACNVATNRNKQQRLTKNNTQKVAFDLNMDNARRLALMFANIRRSLGQTLSDNGDFRVGSYGFNEPHKEDNMQKNNTTNIGALLSGICACLMLFAPAMCSAQQYTITTVAGGKDVASNSGLATDREMYPSGIAVDSVGNFYVADGLDVVYKVTSTGNISVFAGTLLNGGYSGDGSPATGAQLYSPEGWPSILLETFTSLTVSIAEFAR